MSTKRKNLILRLHNRLRNKVALGQLSGYPKAVRMPMLRWDDELAFLAELNVKQCEMKHDECRNTDKFHYAGQNLAYIGGGNSNAERIKALVRKWFEEYKDANSSFIDKYRRHPNGKAIGHFTAMIQDRTDTIGCAILRHTKNSHFFLACNYSFTNMVKDKVYTKGQKSCSKCRTGCNAIYKGLCNPHEYVNPDPDEDLD
ncbi:antigen 5 like allergen Cul n 1-like [Culicoides brevitarsis]|uniref:antigen 5 like allergen Cul n 1-like n=1 Tax=Culicoides brevitarsis TaxID=469753 RepID=UPI00307C43A6